MENYITVAMKCIAIDDEILALELLKSYIAKISFLNLSGAFTDPLQAIGFISKSKIDLIFCDIEMADINGIQLVTSLQYKPIIIFITAYDRYALDGFDLDAVDYILKPVTFDRFLKAVNKAHDFYNKSHIKSDYSADKIIIQQNINDYIFIKTETKLIKVMLSEILYIEGYGDYVKIHTADSRSLLTLNNLSRLENKLPNNNFIRVHRSYIVAMDKIDEIERRRIKIGSDLIPVSETYTDNFLDRLRELSM